MSVNTASQAELLSAINRVNQASVFSSGQQDDLPEYEAFDALSGY